MWVSACKDATAPHRRCRHFYSFGCYCWPCCCCRRVCKPCYYNNVQSESEVEHWEKSSYTFRQLFNSFQAPANDLYIYTYLNYKKRNYLHQDMSKSLNICHFSHSAGECGLCGGSLWMWVCGRPKLNHVFIVTFAIKAAEGPSDRKRTYTRTEAVGWAGGGGGGARGVIRCRLSCRHTWNGEAGRWAGGQVGKPDKS